MLIVKKIYFKDWDKYSYEIKKKILNFKFDVK